MSEVVQAATSPVAARDQCEWRLPLVAFVLFEIIAVLIDVYLDDSPAIGILVVVYGGIPLLIVLALYLGRTLIAAINLRWRSATSRFLGPPLALFSVVLLAKVGFPPWRIAFELMRPYYMAYIWTTKPDSSGHRTALFTWFDREMWTGHETMQIVFSDGGDARGVNGYVVNVKDEKGGPCDSVQDANLGFGFYSHRIYVSYVDCSVQPQR